MERFGDRSGSGREENVYSELQQARKEPPFGFIPGIRSQFPFPARVPFPFWHFMAPSHSHQPNFMLPSPHLLPGMHPGFGEPPRFWVPLSKEIQRSNQQPPNAGTHSSNAGDDKEKSLEELRHAPVSNDELKEALKQAGQLKTNARSSLLESKPVTPLSPDYDSQAEGDRLADSLGMFPNHKRAGINSSWSIPPPFVNPVFGFPSSSSHRIPPFVPLPSLSPGERLRSLGSREAVKSRRSKSPSQRRSSQRSRRDGSTDRRRTARDSSRDRQKRSKARSPLRRESPTTKRRRDNKEVSKNLKDCDGHEKRKDSTKTGASNPKASKRRRSKSPQKTNSGNVSSLQDHSAMDNDMLLAKTKAVCSPDPSTENTAADNTVEENAETRMIIVPLSPDYMEASNCDDQDDVPLSPPYSPESVWEEPVSAVPPAAPIFTPGSPDADDAAEESDNDGSSNPEYGVEDFELTLQRVSREPAVPDAQPSNICESIENPLKEEMESDSNHDLLSLADFDLSESGDIEQDTDSDEFDFDQLTLQSEDRLREQLLISMRGSTCEEPHAEDATEGDVIDGALSSSAVEQEVFLEGCSNNAVLEVTNSDTPVDQTADSAVPVRIITQRSVLHVEANQSKRNISFNFGSLQPPKPSTSDGKTYFARQIDDQMKRKLSPADGGLQVQLRADDLGQEPLLLGRKKSKKKKRKNSLSHHNLSFDTIPSMDEALRHLTDEDLAMMRDQEALSYRLQGIEAELQQSYWEEIEVDEEIFDLMRALKGARRKKSRVVGQIQQLHSEVSAIANLVDPKSVERARKNLMDQRDASTGEPSLQPTSASRDEAASTTSQPGVCPSYIRLPDSAPAVNSGDRLLTFEQVRDKRRRGILMDEYLQIVNELRKHIQSNDSLGTTTVSLHAAKEDSREEGWSCPSSFAALIERIKLLGLVHFRAGFAGITKMDPFDDLYLLPVVPSVAYCLCDTKDCSRPHLGVMDEKKRRARSRKLLIQLVSDLVQNPVEADVWIGAIDSVLEEASFQPSNEDMRDLLRDLLALSGSLDSEGPQVL